MLVAFFRNDTETSQEHRAMREGTEELLRLADLLLIGAATTRKIADMRGFDRDQLYAIVARAEEMAADVKELCRRGEEAMGRAN